MHLLHQSVGIAVIVAGILFMMLSLVAAYREVFPPAEHLDQMRRTADTRSYAELLATVNTLKNWLAMAIVGIVMVFLGSWVASGGSSTLATVMGLQAPPAAVQPVAR
jgi:hypothetical protein